MSFFMFELFLSLNQFLNSILIIVKVKVDLEVIDANTMISIANILNLSFSVIQLYHNGSFKFILLEYSND